MFFHVKIKCLPHFLTVCLVRFCLFDSQDFHTSVLPQPTEWHHTSTLRCSDKTIQYLKNTPAIWNLRKRKKSYQHCVNNTALPFKSEDNGRSWIGRHPGRCQNMFSALFQGASCHFSQGNRGKQSAVFEFGLKYWSTIR